MREIKIKDYSKQEKKWILIKLFENTSETLSEFINLYDYNGQELFTKDGKMYIKAEQTLVFAAEIGYNA